MGEAWGRIARRAVQLARAQTASELVEHTRTSDQGHVCTACTQATADPAPDRARPEDRDARHAAYGPGGTSGAISQIMKALTKYKKPESGAIGYALAWLLGIPLPILLIVFLIRGCD